jgi:DNA helicase II / ATP-dependent DNA helicase PcrA
MPLTPQQLAAISGTNRNNLLLAGPGTGKSFTLLGYIERLVRTQNIAAERILVITFTRAATHELKRDIAHLLGEGAILPHVYTLHSFSLRQLMRNVARIAYLPTNFSIADDYEERYINEDLKRQLSIRRIRDVRDLFNRLASNWETLNADRTDWETTFDSPEFLGAWREHRQIYGYVLRAELVYQFKKALEETEGFSIEGPIDHIIVDEYQDLNRCDLHVVNSLRERGARLFAAGDDDQSIYGFRYAYPEGIRNFTAEIHDSGQHTITECQRCDRRILEFAMNVVRQDFRRVPKTLNSTTGQDGTVALLKFANQEQEAEKISQIVLALKQRHQYNDNDFLILLRSDFNNSFSLVIKDRLSEHGISINEEEQRYSILDTVYARRLVSMVKYFSNPSNDLAVRTIVSTTRGIGPAVIESIEGNCRQNQKRFHETISDICNGSITGIRSSALIAASFQPVVNLQHRITNEGLTFPELLDAAIQLAGGTDCADFSRDFRELLAEEGVDSIDKLVTFVTDILGPAEPANSDLPGVRIMSMHRAKGLTSKVVFVVAVEDEYLPGRDEPDESRRLLYVSLTRAKHYLFATFCTSRTGQQSHTGFLRQHTSARTLSRFLTDLPSPRPVSGVAYQP